MSSNAPTKRLAQEFRALQRSIESGAMVGVSNLAAVGDDMFVWRFHLDRFDADTPQGAQLNRDLASLVKYRHPAAVIMEARFPPNYPLAPFFLRVVSPRMAYLTGHITAGGSVCIEALTNSGSEASWQPSYTVETILATVMQNMLHCESVHVSTATGPGGRSGPLRVDTSRGAAVVQEYSMAEANAAFQRALAGHGWGRGETANAAAARALHPAVLRAAQPPTAPAAHRQAPQSSAASAVASAAPHLAAPREARKPVAPVAQRPRSPCHDSRNQVVDLTLTSEDEDDEAAIAQQQALGRRRLHAQAAGGPTRRGSSAAASPGARRSGGNVIDLVGPSWPSEPRAASPRKRQRPPPPPSLQERLDAANGETGLHLVLPPPHWKVSEALLRGDPTFEQLSLPGDAGGQAADGAGPDDGALGELQGNGLSREEARAALAAAGGDLQKAIAALLKEAQDGSEREASLAELRANGLRGPEASALLESAGGDVRTALAMLVSRGAAQPAAVRELRRNGVSRDDAVAALEASGGNVDQALLYCLECREAGSAPAARAKRAAKAKQSSSAPSRPRAEPDDEREERMERERARAAEAARIRAEAAEVAAVLARFEEAGGIKAERVVRVERVQNLALYSDYHRKRAKVAKDCGAANEARLFHGAEKDTIRVICSEGFDIRVSNLAGALGAGVYFAQTSAYSDAYARAPSRTVSSSLRPVVAQRGPGGGAWNGLAPLAAQLQHFALATGAPVHAPPPAPAGPGPAFVPGCVTMLLCDVVLGVCSTGGPSLRRPPQGSHSTSAPGIFAVYDNAQAYPAYAIHYR